MNISHVAANYEIIEVEKHGGCVVVNGVDVCAQLLSLVDILILDTLNTLNVM